MATRTEPDLMEAAVIEEAYRAVLARMARRLPTARVATVDEGVLVFRADANAGEKRAGSSS